MNETCWKASTLTQRTLTRRSPPRRVERRLPVAAAGSAVGLLDRVDQLGLGHGGPPGYVQPPREVHQMRLRRIGVDAFCRGPLGVRATAARSGVRRPPLRLGLPVVAHLLETVLQGAVGDAVGAFAL